MTRVQKIKKWCKDNPDYAVATVVIGTFSILSAVAIAAEVKEEKKTKRWTEEQRTNGRRVLTLFDGNLVSVNPDVIEYN